MTLTLYQEAWFKVIEHPFPKLKYGQIRPRGEKISIQVILDRQTDGMTDGQTDHYRAPAEWGPN